MYRHWVGKLTATLSIVLAVGPLIWPDYFTGGSGLIHTQWMWWIASAIAFFIAARVAWGEERRKRIAAEQKLEDSRPKLGINSHSVEGPREWAEHRVPVTFTIQHLSGRVPISIRFDAVLSKLGRFSLRFDSLPHVDSTPHQTGMRFEVVEVGAPKLSAKDWEATKPYQKELLELFLNDRPEGLSELKYPLIANFLDGDEPCSQAFLLRFEMDRFRFSEDTSAGGPP